MYSIQLGWNHLLALYFDSSQCENTKKFLKKFKQIFVSTILIMNPTFSKSDNLIYQGTPSSLTCNITHNKIVTVIWTKS